MAGKLGFGAQFKYDAGGGSYTAIAKVTKIRAYTLKSDVVDISDHDSSGRYREKVTGMLECGSVGLDLNYDADAATHQALEGFLGVAKSYRIVFPGAGRTATFTGFLETLSPEVPHDNKMTCSASVVITGAVTWA